MESPEILCRFCLGDDSDSPLLTPCLCSGTQQHLHYSCLRKWQEACLKKQDTAQHCRAYTCSVCMTPYSIPFPIEHPTEAFLVKVGGVFAVLLNVLWLFVWQFHVIKEFFIVIVVGTVAIPSVKHLQAAIHGPDDTDSSVGSGQVSRDPK